MIDFLGPRVHTTHFCVTTPFSAAFFFLLWLFILFFFPPLSSNDKKCISNKFWDVVRVCSDSPTPSFAEQGQHAELLPALCPAAPGWQGSPGKIQF